jgi:hypothetical protein
MMRFVASVQGRRQLDLAGRHGQRPNFFADIWAVNGPAGLLRAFRKSEIICISLAPPLTHVKQGVDVMHAKSFRCTSTHNTHPATSGSLSRNAWRVCVSP